MGFHIHLPYSAEILSGLSLHGYYAHCLNYCEFTAATALLCPENNVSLYSSPIYGCYNLSVLSSAILSKPRVKEYYIYGPVRNEHSPASYASPLDQL